MTKVYVVSMAIGFDEELKLIRAFTTFEKAESYVKDQGFEEAVPGSYRRKENEAIDYAEIIDTELE